MTRSTACEGRHEPTSFLVGIAIAETALVGGWLTSRLAFSAFRTVEIGPFLVLPGFMLACALTFLLGRALIGGNPRLLPACFLAGVIADSLFYWIVRPGTGAAVDVAGPWDAAVFLGSAAALGVMMAVLALLVWLGSLRRARPRPVGAAPVVVCALALVAGLVAFRYGNHSLQHLPNEERSVFVAGCEIHHAYQGAFWLAVLAMACGTRLVGNGLLGFLLLGGAASMLLDQATYILLVEVTDEAYLGPISYAGAAAVSALFVIDLGVAWRRDASRRRPRMDRTALAAKLLSHRVRGFAEVENSRAALAGGIAAGVAYLEIDTRVTRDGRIYVHHDPMIATPGGREIRFADASAAEIDALRHADGESVMSLEACLETFAAGRPPARILCIDIKDHGFEAEHLDAVRAAGVEDAVVFVSWIPQSLLRLRELGARAPLVLSHLNLHRDGLLGRILAGLVRGLRMRVGSLAALGADRAAGDLGHLERGFQHVLICQRLPEPVRAALRDGGGVCVHRNNLCPALARHCREAGLRLWTFSSDSPADFAFLAGLGDLDVVFADDAPDVLASLRA